MDIARSLERAATIGLSTASYAMSDPTYHMSVWIEVPALWCNLLFTILWGLGFLAQVGLGLWYQQWWFGTTTVIGTILEVIGYAARSYASQVDYSTSAYLAQITTLILGPAFIMAGVYFLLAKIVMIYGRQYSLLKPMHYTAIFCSCDLLSIVIQAIGGGMASVAYQAKPRESTAPGTHVMVAGMAVQVASMTLFMFFFLYFYWRVYQARRAAPAGQPDAVFAPRYAHIRAKRLFQLFPIVIMAASLFVYIRCIYRLIELSGGWSGHLMVNEAYALILDGLMCLLAVYLFVPFHPGFVFGRAPIPVEGLHSKKKVEAAQEEQAVGSSETKLDDASV